MKKAKTAGTFQKTLGHLINVCKYPKVGCSEKGTRHLSVVSSDRKEAADTRTKEILLNIKKYFFTMRVTKHWHRFLREILESPFLQTYKICLNFILGKQMWMVDLLEYGG